MPPPELQPPAGAPRATPAGGVNASGRTNSASLRPPFGGCTRDRQPGGVDEEGVTEPLEAVVRGASERLAPILTVILCGLKTSMVLNTLVVPAVTPRIGSVAATGD